ncbi:DUF333 domain-containing protein [Leptotrichia trevisanii]|uniref:DUF333 domain-containing protein n=1 Tax=Leptotrichia trevisanii TaxID=109328 RepID=UPI0026EB704F|nr:DUF333 domain-containing protein [Leptotrichia trevisanii]
MKNLKVAASVFMIATSIVRMLNPASVFCEKHGGKSINVKDKEGNEVGKCQFKDGTRVDEWHYYRENN